MSSRESGREIVRLVFAWSGRREAALVRLVHNQRLVPHEERRVDSGKERLLVEYPVPAGDEHRVAATLSFIGETFENLTATVEIGGEIAHALGAPRAQHRWEVSLAARRPERVAGFRRGRGQAT